MIAYGLICLGVTALWAAPSERPNIILVMADDQGWGDMGYNDHPFLKTPNFDAMAKEGMVFDRFYAAAPVCSPTRASVLTGRHPFRTRITNHGHYMRPQEETVAEVLKEKGYVTGVFGKLHIGSAQPDTPCNPSGMGFDEWVIGLNFFDNNPYLSRNGVVEKREGKGSVILMDDALAFLEKHKGGDKPMFAVVWFPSPHYPHAEVPDGPPVYEGKPHAGYFQEIALLDQQVGRLRAELRRMQIEKNTIVWYCSDNGGLLKASSGGREMKGSIYEGGLRVPGILEWPARGLKGKVTEPVSTSDMFPTLMAMAGIEWEPKHPLDGIDVTPILEGKVKARGKPMGFWHDFEKGQSTRSDQLLKEIMQKQKAGAPAPHNEWRMMKDTEKLWGYSEDVSKGHVAWNDWPWKLHRINGENYELYHLGDDPMEKSDLSADPAHRERFEKMKGGLDQWMRSVIRSLNGEDYEGATKSQD